MADPTEIEAVKCQCGHPACQTYGLSLGRFYQGCGFTKEEADRIALCWNSFDKLVAAIKIVVEDDPDVLEIPKVLAAWKVIEEVGLEGK